MHSIPGILYSVIVRNGYCVWIPRCFENLSKSKQTKKTISIKEAEEIIKAHSMVEKPSESSSKKEESKKAKKTIKSSKNKKKIRKK